MLPTNRGPRTRAALPCMVLASLGLAPLPGCVSGSSATPPAFCAPAAAQNPPLPLAVDPAVHGRADVSRLTAMAFSLVPTMDRDPQVLDLEPDIVIRGWIRWDRWGLTPSDYNVGYLNEVKAQHIVFLGGTTASAIYRDEATSEAEFRAQLSCDTRGRPVSEDAGNTSFFRASLASPAYRQRLVDIGKLQLDLGVDGVHFDEVSSSYAGSAWDGNAAFDDAHVADFGGFLCDKYGHLDAASRDARFGLASGELDCGGEPAVRGRSFDYRAYLARKGWLDQPHSSLNPLAAEWGRTVGNRPDPSRGTFVETYPSLVYWHEIVLALRTYARETHGREIYISANGIYPFVDFQSVGLYDHNADGPGGAEVNYVPVAGGHLNGGASLMEDFLRLKARSARIAGADVPVALFLDYPGPALNRFYALPESERRDYIRIFAAEAYAAGLFVALPFRTSMPGDPTATELGLVELFRAQYAFYLGHSSLYHGAQDLPGSVGVSHGGVTTHLTRLGDGRTVLHLVNHDYDRALRRRTGVTATFAAPAAPTAVTLVSPDRAADVPAAFTYAGGVVRVDIGDLDAYVAVVAE